MLTRVLSTVLLLLIGLGLLAATAIGLAVMLVYPRLPSLDNLTNYQPVMPLRVYTAEGLLIGEFGRERREFVRIQTVPLKMKEAIIAAEDERFYSHQGVDYISILRALFLNLTSGHTVSGGSTITQQVAKNFLLTPERTLERKFKEALLAYKIEKNLSKDRILELYINQINLGQRAYGFAAASNIYFGKTLDKLSIAEIAMLAGLPQAPSRANPIVNLTRAQQRQRYVLRRMFQRRFIDRVDYDAALVEPLKIRGTRAENRIKAEFVAEMVRQFIVKQFKEGAYTQGYRVYTTLQAKDQTTAYDAVRHGLLAYDRRHGYRGAETHIHISANSSDDYLDTLLSDIADSGDIVPAIVLETSPASVTVYIKSNGWATIRGVGLQFAQSALSTKSTGLHRLKKGSVIRVQQQPGSGEWHIIQLPQVEAAFVATDPNTGAVRALVGGFDFNRNRFNHATQAWRQPGSGFKPFIYSAALEKALSPASIFDDAPLVIEQNGQYWQPKNDDQDYLGPISIRRALTRSRNLVSIRLLQTITPKYAQTYIQKFGFEARKHPAYLTLALGAGSVTPYQMATGYNIFANGGYKVQNYFIDRIEDAQKNIIFKSKPYIATVNAPLAIDPRNAYMMNNLLQDVVKYGTASRALALNRNDLAGKTGTTNSAVDAWFNGYSPRNLVAIVWVGFDDPRSLGKREYGSQISLPIWMNFMKVALAGHPSRPLPMPEGLVLRDGEIFYAEHADQQAQLLQEEPALTEQPSSGNEEVNQLKELLF